MEWFLAATAAVVLSLLWAPSLNALLYKLGVPVAHASFDLPSPPDASFTNCDFVAGRAVFRLIPGSRCLFFRRAPRSGHVLLRTPLVYVEPFLVGEMTFGTLEAKAVARVPMVYFLPPVFAGMFMAAVHDSFSPVSPYTYVQCSATTLLVAGVVAAIYIAVDAKPKFIEDCQEILGFLRRHAQTTQPPG